MNTTANQPNPAQKASDAALAQAFREQLVGKYVHTTINGLNDLIQKRAHEIDAARELTAAQGVERPDDDWHLRGYTYASKQATKCAQCGEHKHTPLRVDGMDGYVCLTCIDKKLEEFFDASQPTAIHDGRVVDEAAIDRGCMAHFGTVNPMMGGRKHIRAILEAALPVAVGAGEVRSEIESILVEAESMGYMVDTSISLDTLREVIKVLTPATPAGKWK